MSNTLAKPESKLVSLDWIANRWSVSRTTAQRILEKADARAIFLSGAPRGVRRYREVEVERIEAAASSA